MSGNSSGQLSKALAVPVLAFALLFSGLATTAVGNAVAASKKRTPTNDADADAETTSATTDVDRTCEIVAAFAASFYLAGAVLLLIISIRLFVWKRKWVTPQEALSRQLS